MKTVTLDICSLTETLEEFSQTWKEQNPSEARISFATPELLWKVLTAKRWQIIKIMTGQGALAIREVARRVGRDVKAVHGDIHALLNVGLLEKTPEGIVFPYDAVHVDFMLEAA